MSGHWGGAVFSFLNFLLEQDAAGKVRAKRLGSGSRQTWVPLALHPTLVASRTHRSTPLTGAIQVPASGVGRPELQAGAQERPRLTVRLARSVLGTLPFRLSLLWTCQP